MSEKKNPLGVGGRVGPRQFEGYQSVVDDLLIQADVPQKACAMGAGPLVGSVPGGTSWAHAEAGRRATARTGRRRSETRPNRFDL
jgi:hypothetical protein